MVRRIRACAACHALKTKCDASISNPDVCGRCVRFNLICVPAGRRRQRDRIAELEAQAGELKAALQASRSSTPGTSLASGTSAGPAGEDDGSPRLSRDKQTPCSNDDLRAFLDGLVTKEQQTRGYKAFRDCALRLWPVVQLDPRDEIRMRSSSAILLMTILGFGISSQQADIALEVQTKLRRKVMVLFGDAAIGVAKPSLDLVQSLLIAAFWHRPAFDTSLGNYHLLVRAAVEISIELGLGGPGMLSSPAAWFSRMQEPLSTDMKATWLACYVASTLSDINVRRTLSNHWTQWHRECFDTVRGDNRYAGAFIQLVEMAHIYEVIASRHELCNLSASHDIISREEDTSRLVDELHTMVQGLRDKIPPSWGHLSGEWQFHFWYHIADIYINEPILHTSTNKGSFAAPFVAERIGVEDFACPEVVTLRAVQLLKSLVESCHAAIGVVSCMTPEAMLGLPSLCFAPSVSYALWILVKVHVAISAPGNTYGRSLSHHDLGLRGAMQKLKAVNGRLQEADPGLASWNTRIIGSVEWLEVWLDDYEVILRQYQANMERSSTGGPARGIASADENA